MFLGPLGRSGSTPFAGPRVFLRSILRWFSAHFIHVNLRPVLRKTTHVSTRMTLAPQIRVRFVAGDQQGRLHRDCRELRHRLLDEPGDQDCRRSLQGRRRLDHRRRYEGIQGLRPPLQRTCAQSKRSPTPPSRIICSFCNGPVNLSIGMSPLQSGRGCLVVPCARTRLVPWEGDELRPTFTRKFIRDREGSSFLNHAVMLVRPVNRAVRDMPALCHTSDAAFSTAFLGAANTTFLHPSSMTHFVSSLTLDRPALGCVATVGELPDQL